MFKQNITYGLRTLLKNPGFTVTAVLTLALGIGATTAIFSVVYATLFEPLPYPKPDQLVVVWSKVPGETRNEVSPGDFFEWRKRSQSFQALEAWTGGFINISQNAKKLLFAGTFTAGGLKIEIVDGNLGIASEGRSPKFIDRVEQITFSGSYAAETGQPVFYVTERCVFQRTTDGLELIEIAPGIDPEKDILPHMGFQPIMRDPRPMNPLIFKPEPMGLEHLLLD